MSFALRIAAALCLAALVALVAPQPQPRAQLLMGAEGRSAGTPAPATNVTRFRLPMARARSYAVGSTLPFSTSGSTFSLIASTYKIEYWVQAPRAEAVSAICVNVAAVASPPVYELSVQGYVPAAGGETDGIVKQGGGASGTFTPVAGVNCVPMTTHYTPAVNEEMMFVLAYSSGTIGASNYASVVTGAPLFVSNISIIGGAYTYNGSAWSAGINTFADAGWRSSTGTQSTYGTPVVTPGGFTKTTFATQEVGTAFTLPSAQFPRGANIVGASLYGAFACGAGDVGWLTLYAGAGQTVVAQGSLPLGSLAVACGDTTRVVQVTFPTPVIAVAGTKYYLGWSSSSTPGNAQTLVGYDVPTLADLSDQPLGTAMFGSYRTLNTAATTSSGPVNADGGAWSDQVGRYGVEPIYNEL